MLLGGWGMFVDDAMDCRSGDAVNLCQLAKALPLLAVPDDGFTIKIQRLTPDVPALELGAPLPPLNSPSSPGPSG
jgi:hypothetical protein